MNNIKLIEQEDIKMMFHKYSGDEYVVGFEQDDFNNDLLINAYYVEDMLQKPYDFEDFLDIVSENALDKEEMLVECHAGISFYR